MKVLHIRTGGAAPARIVDHWIDVHALDCRTVDDPYRACALLVNSPQFLPEIVFLGLDRLHADELRIAAYIRETWPGATLTTYGGEREYPGLAGPSIHCDSESALEQFLSAGPPRDVVRSLSVRPPMAAPVQPPIATPGRGTPPIDLPSPRVGGLSQREIAALLGGGAG